MADEFDPYLQWLSIRDPQRPPNHYRLLGVELFEEDPVVLTHAADRQMSYVRKFQAGKRSAESQQLLNEIAAAKVCLLQPQKKAAYDAKLKVEQQAAGEGPADLIPPAVAFEEPAAEPEGAAPGTGSGWLSRIAALLARSPDEPPEPEETWREADSPSSVSVWTVAIMGALIGLVILLIVLIALVLLGPS